MLTDAKRGQTKSFRKLFRKYKLDLFGSSMMAVCPVCHFCHQFWPWGCERRFLRVSDESWAVIAMDQDPSRSYLYLVWVCSCCQELGKRICSAGWRFAREAIRCMDFVWMGKSKPATDAATVGTTYLKWNCQWSHEESAVFRVTRSVPVVTS